MGIVCDYERFLMYRNLFGAERRIAMLTEAIDDCPGIHTSGDLRAKRYALKMAVSALRAALQAEKEGIHQ